MTDRSNVQPLPRPPMAGPDAVATRRVFVRDLIIPCLIGVHRHERDGKQRVRINIDLAVIEDGAPDADRLSDVVCYETVIDKVRAIADAGHINLVETLAERIAIACLGDPRVARATIRVEKLDVFSDAAAVGVEITRHNAKI